MSAQFGNIKIGGVQYNGQTIGEAMYEGQIVYRSVPPSFYPDTGTVGGGSYSTATTLVSHTVAEDGTFTVDWEVTCTEGIWSPQISRGSTILATGTQVAMQGTTLVSWTGSLHAGEVINFRVTQSIVNIVVVSGTWSITEGEPALPVVTITGTGTYASRNQFRDACIAYGTTYQSVKVLPFRLDASQATNMGHIFNGCTSLTSAPKMDTSNATRMDYMFYACSSLTAVPDMDTSNATRLDYMFYNCPALTDGNVRLVGKHPTATTSGMITNSGLTRLPFFDTNGNPI